MEDMGIPLISTIMEDMGITNINLRSTPSI